MGKGLDKNQCRGESGGQTIEMTRMERT
jgi:hypothetical protein